MATDNRTLNPTFRFMPVDWDGKVRMDCSSPYAMARLIGMRDKFDVAFANDTDADRHGIVARSNGLLNPNHYLAVAISYLYENRPGWSSSCSVGKTIVSSGIIDRVAAKLGRKLVADKDGIILGLLAAEITAQTKRDPSEAYDHLTRELGVPFYERIDVFARHPNRKIC